MKSEIEELLRDRLCDADGVWSADDGRLPFAAAKPEERP
jgi:hypothetical protein